MTTHMDLIKAWNAIDKKYVEDKKKRDKERIVIHKGNKY